MAIINGTNGNDSLTGTVDADVITGLNGNDQLYGLAGNDSLSGGAGNDYLEDTEGTNTLDGGAGNDTYFFEGAATTTIKDASGIDTVKALTASASIANYTMIENIDASGVTTDGFTYTGNSLNNTIYGTQGNNTLSGGLGNDTYVIQGNTETISEDGPDVKNSGIDTIKLSGSTTGIDLTDPKYGYIENIDGSERTETELTLTGNSLSNTITGAEVNDTIDGKTGVDNMIGGRGNDTYTVDNLLDKVTEMANTKTVTDTGIDTIKFDSTFDFGKSKAYTLATNVENLDLNYLTLTPEQQAAFGTTKFTINGNGLDNTINSSANVSPYLNILAGAGNDTVYGGSWNGYIDGGVGNDEIRGGNGNESLSGGAGNDSIYGGEGTNSLYGGDGNDFLDNNQGLGTMYGGAGNDTYNVLGSITSIIDSAGIDTIITGGSMGLEDWTTIENLDASAVGFNDLNLKGNSLNNTIFGGTGTGNTYTGGLGDDTYVIKKTTDSIVEQDSSIKNSGNDTIKISGGQITNVSLTNNKYLNVENIDSTGATAGVITLAGNMSINTLTGSNIQGNSSTLDGGVDSVVDTLKGGIENTNFVIHDLKDKITDAGGEDFIVLANDYHDNAKLAGASYTLTNTSIEGIDASALNKNSTLKGNAKTGTEIISGSGDDDISGGTAIDSLFGGEGVDTLYGGNDKLTDILEGHDGNDTYLIQDIQDNISDSSGTADTIKLMATFDNDANAKTAAEYTVTNANIEIIDASLMTKSIIINGANNIDTTIRGGSGNDTLRGRKANETIYGGAGNDTLSGGEGSDQLNGEDGNDTFLVDSAVWFGGTDINGGAGIDTIKLVADANGKLDGASDDTISLLDAMNVENIDASAITATTLTLVGNEFTNSITGSINDDTIDGAEGVDTMVGGRGNDTYTVDNYLDVVTETANTKTVTDSGIDTIKFAENFGFGKTKAYTLSANVENLDLNQLDLNADQQTAFENRTLIINGNALNNEITTSDNWSEYIKIMAGAGNDTVQGGTGSDYIDGGVGDDEIQGYDGNDTLYGRAGNDYLVGQAGDDILYGDDGNDSLEGGDGNDVLYGGAGNDTLEGGMGTNDLQGGIGDDTYLYGDNADTTITEAKNAGSDTLKLIADADTGAYVGDTDNFALDAANVANIENIDASEITSTFDSDNTGMTLTGNSLDNKITGSAMDDTIDGGAGKNTLMGGAGNDTYIIDGSATVTTITDSAGTADTIKLVAQNQDTNVFAGGSAYSIANFGTIENVDASVITSNITLTGNSLNNTITGGSGVNTLIGGAGDDTYVIRSASDKITEAASAGSDTVKLSNVSTLETINLTSYANVENIDGSLSVNILTLTGNSLDNILKGGNQNDTIYGNAGNDTLQGHGGVNELYGEDGDDTFLVDGTETMEGSIYDGGTGVNTIKAVADADGMMNGGAIYEASIKDVATIQNIDGSEITATELTMEGNALANTIKGGTSNDTIDGGVGVGIDTLIGGLGNDTYILNKFSDVITEAENAGIDTLKMTAVSGLTTINLNSYANVENIDGSEITDAGTDLILTGNGLSNTITGGDGNDILDGVVGDGIDTLIGGLGGDTYFVGDASDVIIDSDGKNGIQLKATFKTGTIDLSANNYSDATITTIDGGLVTDSSVSLSLIGNDSDNTILGGDGNDTITGGAGIDKLYGEKGNDTFLMSGIETIGGGAVLDGGEGIDTIKAVADGEGKYNGQDVYSASIADADTIENIDCSAITSATSEITMTGNSLNNVLIGGAGNDTLIGGLGNDTLTGGAGNNTYSLAEGDEKDLLTATGAGDIIKIDATTGITIDDVLFYTDTAGNLYVDYTDGSIGGDIVKIPVGEFNNDTTISVGDTTTTIGAIIPLLDTYAGLRNIEIDQLTFADKGIQAAEIISAWNLPLDPSGDNTYMVTGTQSTTIDETAEGGIDTLKLVAPGGAFAGSTGLFPTPSTVTIDDLSTTPNTIENLDASAVTLTNLTLTGNNLDNIITGGRLNDSIFGGSGNDTISGGVGNNPGPYSFFVDSFGPKFFIDKDFNDQPIYDTVVSYGATDTLDGGAGNDTYLFDGDEQYYAGGNWASVITKTIITENDGDGSDTIKLVAGVGGTYGNMVPGGYKALNLEYVSTNANTVENIDATAITSTELTLIGNNLDNIILGGGGNDTIYGSADTGLVNGGAGNDTMYGGAGSNTLSGGVDDDTYLISGLETATTIVEINGNDTITLINAASPDRTGVFAGGTSYSIENNTQIENLNASYITSGMTLTGNDSSNIVSGGSGNDTLAGGTMTNTLAGVAGDDILLGGDGDDTYILNGNEASVSITDTNGNDTVKLTSMWGGHYFGESAGDTTISLGDYTGVDNINASAITLTALTLEGDSSANTITGGALNDIISGGAGNDFLTGGLGNDTFNFLEGDAIDLITSTNASDIIKIDNNSGITTADILFYTDVAGNFYADYTDDSIGSDIVKIAGGQYNNGTTITIGTEIITIGDVLPLLGSYANLDATAISNLTFADKGTQSTTMDPAWVTPVDPSGDNIYLIAGTQATKITEVNGAGIDTLKLVAQGDGSFVGSTGLFPNPNEVYIDNLSTNPNTIENLDASSVTSDMILGGNNLDNTITGGAGYDSLYGGAGTNVLKGGAGDDAYLIDGTATATTIDDKDGFSRIILVADGDGKYNGANTSTISLVDYADAGAINARAITATTLTLIGNDSDNNIMCGTLGATVDAGLGNDFIDGGVGNDTISGGDGDDTIMGEGGNDTLSGNSGSNTYIFYGGDANDTITSTTATDLIILDNSASEITKSDVLFYTDDSGNLHIDYTKNAIGADTIQIASANVNSGTTIFVGSDTINISIITQYLAGSGSVYTNLDSTAISALTTVDEATQALALTWTPA